LLLTWILFGRIDDFFEMAWQVRGQGTVFATRSTQNHAGAGSPSNQGSSFVKDVAFDQTNHLASPNHLRLSAKPRFPNRPKKIGVQLDRGERFARSVVL
jgi:hypothetical protein